MDANTQEIETHLRTLWNFLPSKDKDEFRNTYMNAALHELAAGEMTFNQAGPGLMNFIIYHGSSPMLVSEN